MKLKQILISQPVPSENEKSPYKDLADKFNLKLTFKKFIKIEGVPSKDFRKERIDLSEYGGVIMLSKNAVDHFFRMSKEMRLTISEDTKYYCLSETTARYLQNYVQYRKRKIFFAKNQRPEELAESIIKHLSDNILIPCAENIRPDISQVLEKHKIKVTKANLFKTVPDDVATELDVADYDMLVFFSPFGIKSLFQNFPKFKQGKTLIAAFGQQTMQAVEEAGLRLDVPAPTTTAPSMTTAIDEYLTKLAKESVKAGKSKK